MSLLDALLLDPAPLKAPTGEGVVFLAVRNDGVIGSGTANDPYNGSRVTGTSLDVSLSRGGQVVIADTGAVLHGFATDDTVVISDEGSPAPNYYNGTFQITVTSPTKFEYTTAGIPSGDPIGSPKVTKGMSEFAITLTRKAQVVIADTVSPHGFVDYDIIVIEDEGSANPNYYNGVFQIDVIDDLTFTYTTFALPSGAPTGSPKRRKDTFLFDKVMKDLPEKTAVHLGSGIFQTRGYAGGGFQNSGWYPKSGQKIRGSGIGATVLRLEYACAPNYLYFAVSGASNNYLDSFEMSDLTVDCNMGGQPKNGLALAPVACGAVNTAGKHIRLQRLRVINFGTQTGIRECFVLVTGGQHPGIAETFDDRITDCIVEMPSLNNIKETTCIAISGHSLAFHRACVIRNCFVNIFATSELGAPEFHGVGADGGTAAVVEGNRVFNCNIGGPYHDTGPTRDQMSRGNYYHNCLNALDQLFYHGTGPRVGTPFVNLVMIELQPQGGDYFARATVNPAHKMQAGDGVMIRDAGPDDYYNGDYMVTAVSTDRTTFDYKLASNPGGNASPAGKYSQITQTHFLCAQENHINLSNIPGEPITAFRAAGDQYGPPYIFQNLLIQDDVIDEIQFPVGQTDGPTPMVITTARNTLAIGNVTGVFSPASGFRGLQYGDCASVMMFGNRRFGGEGMPVKQVLPPDLSVDPDGLAQIEEAIVLSLL